MNALPQRLISAAVLSLFGLSAQATILTFDELAHPDLYRFVSPYVSNGYIVTNGTQPIDLGVWGHNSARQAHFGGAALFTNYAYTTTTVTHVAGDVFDFRSIDLADVYNQPNSFSVDFTFTFADGLRTVESITRDSAVGLQTFAFNKVGVTSVSWVNSPGSVFGMNQFDNVVLGSVTTPVPEPQTYALMLAGLSVLTLVARRRRIR